MIQEFQNFPGAIFGRSQRRQEKFSWPESRQREKTGLYWLEYEVLGDRLAKIGLVLWNIFFLFSTHLATWSI